MTETPPALPTNLEAEQALLGILLVNNSSLRLVTGVVTAADFALPVHGHIFDAVRSMVAREQVVNPVTLRPHFDGDEALQDTGGAQYLARLAGSAVMVINAGHHAAAVADLSLRRRVHAELREAATAFIEYPYQWDVTAFDQIEAARVRIEALVRSAGADNRLVQAFADQGADQWAAAPPAIDWIVPGWLPASCLTLLSGHGGRGMTKLATMLCAGLAAGQTGWLGGGPAIADPSPQTVVYASWKNTQDDMRRFLGGVA